MSLGKRLRQVRDGVSQKDFCELFSIAQNTLRKYERDEGAPDTNFVLAVCQHYKLNLTWLVTGEGPMHVGESIARPGPDQRAQMEEPLHAFDSLGMAEGMAMLAKIYSTGDNVYIRAINANLMAFTDSVDNKAKVVALTETIHEIQSQMQSLRDQIGELKREVLLLRNENSELKNALRARGGNDKEAATG